MVFPCNFEIVIRLSTQTLQLSFVSIASFSWEIHQRYKANKVSISENVHRTGLKLKLKKKKLCI